MIDTIGIVFPVLVGFVVILIILAMWLFKAIEKDHPETYEALGRPSFLWHGSLENAMDMMRFLFKREYASLGNPTVRVLGDLILLISVLYAIGFFVGFYQFKSGQG